LEDDLAVVDDHDRSADVIAEDLFDFHRKLLTRGTERNSRSDDDAQRRAPGDGPPLRCF